MELFFRKLGQGKPLIILHGLFGQSDNWNTLAKKYAESGYEVWVIDQRNHGLSPHSDIWNYDAMAEDLRELIEKENLVRPVLLGHSMGGKTVMFFDLLFPGIAEKIIVADISPRAYPPHHNKVLEALLSLDLFQLDSRKKAEDHLTSFQLDFGTRQFLLKNLYRLDETESAAKQQTFNWRFNLSVISDNISEVNKPVPTGKGSCPYLFVKGSASDYILDSDEEQIKILFPDSKIECIDGAGHWLHAEKPEEFLRITLDFMNS